MELRECSTFIKRQLIVYLSPAMSTADLCLYKLCSPNAGVTFVTQSLSTWESPQSKANDPFFIFKSFGLFLAYQVPIQTDFFNSCVLLESFTEVLHSFGCNLILDKP